MDEVQKNADFHKDSDIPKLFINADPGSILISDQGEFEVGKIFQKSRLKEITLFKKPLPIK